MILCVSAPVQPKRLPPPPGFIPPSPSVISVSVLNPFTAAPNNYKINTALQTCNTNTTKSILREPGYSVKNVSDRVVSFDLENSTKKSLKQSPKLPSKRSNPSMPNLHYYGGSRLCSNKNPFLTDVKNDTIEDDLNDSSESESDTDEPDNNNIVESEIANIDTKTVKLGENFFASLFNNNKFSTNTIPDPWSAAKFNEAAPTAKITRPHMTTASVTSGLSPLTPAANPSTQKSPVINQTRPDESGSAASATTAVSNTVKAEDKYSALKELDEIFKSTVTVNDGKN